MIFDEASLERAEISVTVGRETYVLRQARGDVAIKYENALQACTRVGPDGKFAYVVGIAETPVILLAGCLFKKFEKNGITEYKAVSEGTIKGWPPTIIDALFKRAKEISGLNRTGTPETVESVKTEIAKLQKRLAELEESRKNDSESTEDGTV